MTGVSLAASARGKACRHVVFFAGYFLFEVPGDRARAIAVLLTSLQVSA